MKFNLATTVIAALAFVAGANAISCQSQGGSCHDGGRDCPAGTRSVFWDSGCAESHWWWTHDDKCCVPN
ncbi:hypothetical protein AGABI2DRAFT_194962 [Agaricus bisporus var. bisporus H97]|uniref:hypothetical protein n=1 Tax=Agaricus bisporus var. bisporus (strain H97 / ATCC MYA-4626 / FGSC 10389) TaxID=936046 RepID=UPI00029F5469|nr:hypothetical protein AGABI2DRAFT_194962 [Agaricus bisporus var. bisporus H97]EKV44100.1 hypothetical protein AGABI2DRAFT_194962 [Agaricus bisporus var. bisporus H97]